MYIYSYSFEKLRSCMYLFVHDGKNTGVYSCKKKLSDELVEIHICACNSDCVV